MVIDNGHGLTIREEEQQQNTEYTWHTSTKAWAQVLGGKLKDELK